jgi:hypothetical protein
MRQYDPHPDGRATDPIRQALSVEERAWNNLEQCCGLLRAGVAAA